MRHNRSFDYKVFTIPNLISVCSDGIDVSIVSIKGNYIIPFKKIDFKLGYYYIAVFSGDDFQFYIDFIQSTEFYRFILFIKKNFSYFITDDFKPTLKGLEKLYG